jgi:hypothetical protein
VNRSRWLPIAGLLLALLMAMLDIFEYPEVVHKRQRRHSSLGMLTPIEFENAFTWHENPATRLYETRGTAMARFRRRG